MLTEWLKFSIDVLAYIGIVSLLCGVVTAIIAFAGMILFLLLENLIK
jgi:hypothetical protein